MSKLTDQAYLTGDQYRDSSNLDARVALHKRYSTNPRGWFPWVFDTLEKLPSPARVLELGCGPGLLWSNNAPRIPPGWVITLSDLSDGMLQAAWRSLVVTSRAFKYEKIDAQSIPHPDETFDIVIANHMLYHVPDRAKALGEIRRVLKPGGHFLASTFGDTDMRALEDWIRRVKPDYQRPAFGFILENGAAQLAPFFKDVSCLRYPDGLRITEVEPVIDYIRSRASGQALPATAIADLRIILEEELHTKGILTVSKDTGLFVAVR